MLGLETPSTTDGSWPVSDLEMKQSYRHVSLMVHPDKNHNSEDAQTAFARVNAAWNCLSDMTLRGDYVKSFLEAAPRATSSWVPTTGDTIAATVDADIARRKRSKVAEKGGVSFALPRLVLTTRATNTRADGSI